LCYTPYNHSEDSALSTTYITLEDELIRVKKAVTQPSTFSKPKLNNTVPSLAAFDVAFGAHAPLVSAYFPKPFANPTEDVTTQSIS
jgi:hypothetical protein